MTREEAIAQLKMDRDLANFNPMTGEEEPINEDCRKSVEALDMAIKALKQQPCEDAIRRADAEALFRNARSKLNPSDYKTADEFNTRDLMLLNAEQFIHLLPSVRPQEPKTDVLDKIRAEIEQMDFDFGDYYDHTNEIIEMVCKVIDKYKVESEG